MPYDKRRQRERREQLQEAEADDRVARLISEVRGQLDLEPDELVPDLVLLAELRGYFPHSRPDLMEPYLRARLAGGGSSEHERDDIVGAIVLKARDAERRSRLEQE